MSERYAAPYVFYGETVSLCETCLERVPAKILIQDQAVWLQKRCRTHGTQKTLISTDVEYYKSCKEYLKPGDRPRQIFSRTEYGCPYDCGLCPDHEQHTCLALIEITNNCNLRCPVCFADSSPEQDMFRPLSEIEAMLDTLVAAEGEPDLLQISGGEPTLHPDIMPILQLAKQRPIRHLMLNTNGIRIANDPDFVAELAALKPGFEVYLQFDSLQKQTLEGLRGVDLRSVRQRALENLEQHNISTSLVAVVQKGVNDEEIGAIIEHALQFRCVRGVTFQPVQDTGRNDTPSIKNKRMLLSDIRRAIAEQSGIFTAEDILPLPCNPESIAIGYGLRKNNSVLPITSLIPKQEWIGEVPNTVSFERYPELKQKLLELLAVHNLPDKSEEKLRHLLCCLPEFDLPQEITYEHVFRVTIVEFMDRYNFTLGGVKRSCIHFVTPEQKIIPFDTYNLFYRDGSIERFRRQLSHIKTTGDIYEP
ncbi:MAG: radical SAM protein [Gammaproteobacteria bacterium]|nr:radical SAM protein [Gammaproteobacteria bacterium]MDH5651872.1 radical SAM protein [Gammaproteobacteria bacterium]